VPSVGRPGTATGSDVVSRLVNLPRVNAGGFPPTGEGSSGSARVSISEGGGGGGDRGGAGESGGAAEAEIDVQPPFLKPILEADGAASAQSDVSGFGDESFVRIEAEDTMAAHPDFLNPPGLESAALNALPQPPPLLPPVGATMDVVGIATGLATEAAAAAVANFTPEAAANRLSSFSSRFRSFSRAFELSLGRCAASISLKRYAELRDSVTGQLPDPSS
jgi:hypothetical protein